MKVKSITIEGFHNVTKKTYEFKDFNYLVGKNASGKTTALQALQLALLGYIPGTNKRTSDIFRHANNHTMAVTATLNDGQTDIVIRRIWTGTRSGVNTSVEVDPDGYNIDNLLYDIELPVFNFGEFIGMTANKLKDWFIEFLPKSETSVDWKSELTSALPDSMKPNTNIDRYVDDINNCGKSGVDQIRWANDYFKQLLSFKKSELDRITSTIQSLIRYDDIDNSISEEDINSKIAMYYDKKSKHDLAVKIDEQNNIVKSRIDALLDICSADSYLEDNNYIKLNERYESILNSSDASSRIAECDTIIRECNKMMADIQSEISFREKLISGNGICPYTEDECKNIKEKIAKYTSEVGELTNQYNSYLEKLKEASDNRVKLVAENDKLNSEKFTVLKQIEAIKDNYYRLSELKSNVRDVNSDDLRDDTNYDSMIASLNTDLGKIKANIRYNNMIDELTRQKFDIQSEMEACKLWVTLTGVNGLQNSISASGPFDYLSSSLDVRIPQLFGADVKSEFHLEAKANSFSFGILRSGQYIPYDLLSSGEKCMYSLCLMMSLVDCSHSPLKLIMVDDLFDHLDDDNINNLFNSLYTVKDIQMIFAGVKVPVITGVDSAEYVVNVI